jgi:AcrR family transcriptional regulator
MKEDLNQKNLSRRDRERQRHREDILSVAVKLFAQKGYHNVSMQEIAAEAQFATGTLYNFFPSKEDLYLTLMRSLANTIYDSLMPILDETIDEREKISRLIREHNRLFQENEAVFRLYISETHGYGKGMSEFDQEIDELLKKGIDKTESVFASGINKGIFRNLNARQMAISLYGMLEAGIMFCFQESTVTGLDQRASIIEDILLKGILKAHGDTNNE